MSLIRKYLQAGVLVKGVFEKTEKGTPQGGNISPILSNVNVNTKLYIFKFDFLYILILSLTSRYIKLKQTIVGWINYFKITNMQKIVQKLDEWIRRRIRMCYWKQWKKIKTKHDNLVKLGINKFKEWEYANTRKSYWRISDTPFLH